MGTLLREDAAFRGLVQFVGPDGTRPIVIAMLDDSVGDLFEYIDRHHPMGANVLVGAESGHFVNLIALREEGGEPFGTLDGDCPVNVDSEVGMLVAYVLLRRGERVRCRPTRSYAVEMLEESAAS